MTGRYAEGWDYFPAAASSVTIYGIMALSGWYTPWGTSAVLSIRTPGRFNYGQKLHVDNGAFFPPNFVHIKLTGTNEVSGFLSIGLNIPDNFQVENLFFLTFYDATANVPQVYFTFEVNGVIGCYRGSPTGVLLGKSDPGTWRHNVDFDVEIFNTTNATIGEAEVRIDTISALHLININTKNSANAYYNAVGYGWINNHGANATMDIDIDDLRFYDTAGSINNTWLGTCRVQTCLVGGNGSTTNFTRSNTGLANWQNLLNKNIDDTLYLYDPTIGDVNLSTIAPLVNSPIVFWAQINGFYRQDDATQRFVKNRISSSSVIADGISFPTTQSYSLDYDIFELDPNTSLQFTGTAFNALQIGSLVYA